MNSCLLYTPSFYFFFAPNERLLYANVQSEISSMEWWENKRFLMTGRRKITSLNEIQLHHNPNHIYSPDELHTKPSLNPVVKVSAGDVTLKQNNSGEKSEAEVHRIGAAQHLVQSVLILLLLVKQKKEKSKDGKFSCWMNSKLLFSLCTTMYWQSSVWTVNKINRLRNQSTHSWEIKEKKHLFSQATARWSGYLLSLCAGSVFSCSC